MGCKAMKKKFKKEVGLSQSQAGVGDEEVIVKLNRVCQQVLTPVFPVPAEKS